MKLVQFKRWLVDSPNSSEDCKPPMVQGKENSLTTWSRTLVPPTLSSHTPRQGPRRWHITLSGRPVLHTPRAIVRIACGTVTLPPLSWIATSHVDAGIVSVARCLRHGSYVLDKLMRPGRIPLIGSSTAHASRTNLNWTTHYFTW